MTNEELAKQIQDGKSELMPALWDGVQHFVYQQAYHAYTRYCRRLGIKAQNDKKNEPKSLLYDFYDSGYLAVTEAAQTFNMEKGVKFLTHLSSYIKKHFSIVCRELSGWSRASTACIQRDITKCKHLFC